MQDSSLYSHIQAQVKQPQPQCPEQEHLKCPRCDSTNTKFCYYNNYNLSQPRHFCKSCKRYWTKGGALRNIPVGGGSRKSSKRSSSSAANAAASSSKRPAAAASASAAKDNTDNENIISSGEMAGNLPLKGEGFGLQFEDLSFSSLLGSSSDQYVGFLDGLGTNGSNLQINGQFGDPGSGQDLKPGLEIGSSGSGDGFLNMQGGGGGGDSGCWGSGGGGDGSNEWPDLVIYTPSSTFQ